MFHCWPGWWKMVYLVINLKIVLNEMIILLFRKLWMSFPIPITTPLANVLLLNQGYSSTFTISYIVFLLLLQALICFCQIRLLLLCRHGKTWSLNLSRGSSLFLSFYKLFYKLVILYLTIVVIRTMSRLCTIRFASQFSSYLFKFFFTYYISFCYVYIIQSFCDY